MNDITQKMVPLIDNEVDFSWLEIEEAGVIKSISNYLLCQVINACHEAGLAQTLYANDLISMDELSSQFNPYLCEHLIKYLQIHDIVKITGNKIEVNSDSLGWFSPIAGAQLGFYLGAYGSVVRNIPSLLTGQSVYGSDVLRDGRALGVHCGTLFKAYHTDTVLQALSDKNSNFILDLGCGAGQFLIDACLRDPNLKGIGLDISEGAIDEAKMLCEKYNLTDRLEFVVADAFKPDHWPAKCHEADVICAVGVIHEHFRDGDDAVVNILNSYEKLISGTNKIFILGEPEIRHDTVKNDCDLYLVHIFTAQGFPRYREQWKEVIERTNFSCTKVYTRPDGGPRFNFFILEPSN
jgi:SAM-dependent methyltransferase